MRKIKTFCAIILAIVMLASVALPILAAESEPEVPVRPASVGRKLNVFLDQTRQEIDGFQLSGAFRQIDHLLNGFSDNPEIQKEVLDLVFGHHTGVDPDTGLPVDPAAKGIGLSIWRNQIADKADLWNYIWRQSSGQSWGRWFDTAAFSFRPYAPNDPTRPELAGLPLNAPNLDDASYRWWFDARDTAARNWDDPNARDTSHIPTAANRWGTTRLNDLIRVTDHSLTYMDGVAYPGWQVREGGPKGNAAFDIFDWPAAPGNQDIVGRNGRSPVDRGQVWASKHAMRYAEARGEEMKIMAAGWSGPAWLKSTGRVNGGNIVNAEWALRDYAHFLVDYVKGWNDIYGIPIWGLSLSNEPNENNSAYSKSGWGTGTATPTGAGQPNYMPFVRDVLGPLLIESGLRTSTYDGTVNGKVEGIRLQVSEHGNWNFGYMTPFWGNRSEQFVDDYLYHTYVFNPVSGGGNTIANATEKEWKVRAQMNNQGIIMSEVSQMNGHNATNGFFNYNTNAVRTQHGPTSRSDMGSAMGWAQYWQRELATIESTGTGQWWAVGFKRPEADWPMLDAPGDQSLENLIYISNDARGQSASPTTATIARGGLEGATAIHRGQTDPNTAYSAAERTRYATAGQNGGYYTEQTFDYRVHKVFWALGHFCKFARPGWHRVNVNQEIINEGTTSPNMLNLTTTAYVSPEPDTDGYYDFAIVVLNGTRQNQTLDINFPGFTVESMERWETREDVLDSSISTANRANFIRGWTNGVRNRDSALAARVPTVSTGVPSHSGTPYGNNMVLKGEVADWSNGGDVTVPFVSMTTFVGRAKIDANCNTAATAITPFYNYANLEGAAFFNNNLPMTDPRVETTRIPTRGAGASGGGGWTQNTGATFTFNNIDFGSGMDALILNIGGGVTGTETTAGNMPIRVFVGGELATATGATVQTSGTATNRTIPFTTYFEGVNDVVITLGANGSNVVARLNSLTFRPCVLNSVVTPPTCLEDGFTTWTCIHTNCNHEYITDIVPALGHDYAPVTADVSRTNLQDIITVTISVNGLCTRCEDPTILAVETLNLKQNGTQIVDIGGFNVVVVVNDDNRITGIYVEDAWTPPVKDNQGNQGGNSQGGNSQGGNSQGGNSQGGNSQGGNSQGGNSQGGNQNNQR